MNKYLALVKGIESQKKMQAAGTPPVDLERMASAPPAPRELAPGASPSDSAANDYPRDPDSGAAFMPWCAPISAGQFRKWRGELIAMIEEVAALDGWSRDDLGDVLSRAINGPVSDLRPNWHYFAQELKRARASSEDRSRDAARSRQAADDLLNRSVSSARRST
jgi:hypothetical protein